MRYSALISIIALLVTGCVEPYPDWSVTDIRNDNMPPAVAKAFRKDFPDARISRVQRSTFESRNSGYPKKYRIFFESSDTESSHVIYDAAGKRADKFDFWFKRTD